MSRVEKTILWSGAICVACFVAAEFLLVKAPAPVMAQPLEPVAGEPALVAEPEIGFRVKLVKTSNQDRLEKAKQALGQAKNDEERKAATANVRQVLEDIFSEDMKSREMQAQEVQERLENLRQQFQARWKVKDEIIDLQIKVLERDAQGLGFPRPPMATGNAEVPLNQKGPSQFGPRKLPQLSLEDFEKTNAVAVGDLLRLGHFLESPDGKLYVYVNSNHPRGPSMVHVRDAASGKSVAFGNFPFVLGPLEFTEEGISSRENDGSLKLRLALSKRAGPDGPVYEARVDTSAGTSFNLTRELPPAATSHKEIISDYSLIQDKYVKAKSRLQNAEEPFNRALAEIREENPDFTPNEVRKRLPGLWLDLEVAKANIDAAKRLCETKLELLDLDRKSANIALDSASRKLERLTKLFDGNTATKEELETQRAERDAAELEVLRTNRLYQLFKSILEVPGEVAPDTRSPLELPGAPATRN